MHRLRQIPIPDMPWTSGLQDLIFDKMSREDRLSAYQVWRSTHCGLWLLIENIYSAIATMFVMLCYIVFTMMALGERR